MNQLEKPARVLNQPVKGSPSIRTGLVFKVLMWLLVPLAAWWSLRDLSLADISGSLRQVGATAILILLGINIFIFILISLRWWMILRAQGWRVALYSVIGYRLAGFGLTYFTPGPQFGGEPAQVYLLKQKEGIPVSPAATSVAIDKLLELLANFSFLLVGVSVLLGSGLMYSGNWLAVIMFPLLLLSFPVIYLLALRYGYRPVSHIVNKIFKDTSIAIRYQGILTRINETEAMVSSFCKRNVVVLLAGAGLSIAIWALMIIEFGLMMQYLGVQFNLVQILIALTAARIAFLLPVPAGLGTLEAGQVMAMGLIGVSPAIGISLSLLIRARDILFGGAGLWLGGFYSR
jgi:uncharacterized protein (TIRG00374 family)